MDQYTIIHNMIHWIRTSVLILSVLILIVSLSQYSKDTVPIFSLLHRNVTDEDGKGDHMADHFVRAMIQDRRLIAILVAAQASIFCPLFLLIGNRQYSLKLSNNKNNNYSNSNSSSSSTEIDHALSSSSISPPASSPSLGLFWKTALDLLCQFLMPLGLALSWLFCISFNHKTDIIIRNYLSDTIDTPLRPSAAPTSIWSFAWEKCAASNINVNSLKYVIVMALVLEMILVTIAWIQYCISTLYYGDSNKSQKKQHFLSVV